MGEPMLEHFFNECLKDKMGVMPFDEFDNKITFVWHDRGYGRLSEMRLTKAGKEYALTRMKEIEEHYDKGRKSKSETPPLQEATQNNG